MFCSVFNLLTFCSVFVLYSLFKSEIKLQKNRPLQSCPTPLFSSEAKCSHTNKTHFHKEGFALTLVLKVRGFRTQKWPTWLLSLRCFSNFCRSLWTKSCKVAFHTKTLKEYFHTILVVNPLNPRSDQHQISPCNINAL